MQSAARPDDKPRRIEVNRILNDDGSSVVLVQDMSYGPGVGWYPQKTIRLDDAQVNALLRKLCCARRRPGAAVGSTATPTKGGERMDLPCLADAAPAPSEERSAPSEEVPETIVKLAEIIEFDWRR